MIRIGKFALKLNYKKYGDPSWGYDYNPIYRFDHEICFYRFCIDWTFENGKEFLE